MTIVVELFKRIRLFLGEESILDRNSRSTQVDPNNILRKQREKDKKGEICLENLPNNPSFSLTASRSSIERVDLYRSTPIKILGLSWSIPTESYTNRKKENIFLHKNVIELRSIARNWWQSIIHFKMTRYLPEKQSVHAFSSRLRANISVNMPAVPLPAPGVPAPGHPALEAPLPVQLRPFPSTYTVWYWKVWPCYTLYSM